MVEQPAFFLYDLTACQAELVEVFHPVFLRLDEDLSASVYMKELLRNKPNLINMILAIETATDVCSVAFENGAGKVFEKRTESHGSHSEKLFQFIRELMEDQAFGVGDLDAVLVSEGPGSYTGLRIAASGVKGLLFGSDVPLYGVSTLASFAAAAYKETEAPAPIHAVIDARRKHVYYQQLTVETGVITACGEVETVPISSFGKMVESGDVIIGTGLERLDESVTKKAYCFEKEFISARSLIQLYYRKESAHFMQVTRPQEFDPRYYTSKV